jgi:hypothetical protein
MIAFFAVRRAGLVIVAWALAACVTNAPVPDKPVPSEVPEESALKATGLRFEVQPADAEVSIGGGAYESAVDSNGGARTVALPPGLYQVSIRRPGYATWRAEVSIEDGIEVIRVSLVQR